MVSLVTMLSASVATLMILVKQLEAGLTAPTDPDQLKQFNDRLDLFNLILSMVLGIVGGLVAVSNTPALFAADPPLIAGNPMLFAIVAGAISVLPGGIGTTLLSGLLVWLGLNPPPAMAQTLDGASLEKPRSIRLWN